MSGFSKGGIIRGAAMTVRFVPEVSPDGLGRLDVIFADECIINKDHICTRGDDWHKGAAITSSRFWICPAHR
jgi:hypothetical protein